MDLSALERAINTLESSIDSLGGWLTFWTTLVVIGLIVEYAEDLKDLIIEGPFNWKLFRTIIGGLLITGGVAGELFVQFKESKLSTDLRSANHKVVAILNDRAAQAGRDAESAKATAKGFEAKIAEANRASAEANARAANAEGQLAEANRRAGEANEKAESFRLDIAKANEGAAKAEQRAAEAELELAKLKLPRTLSSRQQQRLIAKLNAYAGQKFSLAVAGESEPLDLLKILRSILVASGWIKITPQNFGDISVGDAALAYGRGVIVQFAPTATPEVRKRASLMADALNSEGIASKAEADSRVTDASALNVLVGTKP